MLSQSKPSARQDLRERIRTVWEAVKHEDEPPYYVEPDSLGWWFFLRGSDETSVSFSSRSTQLDRIPEYCIRSFHAVRKGERNPLSVVDESLAKRFRFGMDTEEGGDVILMRAFNILKRLPTTPLDLESLHPELYSQSIEDQWNDYSSFTQLDTNTIRIGLALSCDIFRAPTRPSMKIAPQTHREDFNVTYRYIRDYVDILSQLVSEVTQQLASCHDMNDKRSWYSVKAFYWSVWHRGVMLLFWYFFDHQLKWGFDATLRSDVLVQMPDVLPGTSLQDIMTRLDIPKRSGYMCTWAYKSLRQDRFAMPLDFTGFHQRFNDTFRYRKSRCSVDGQPCDGSSPKACRRFTGAETKGVNQSAHDFNCRGDCHRLFWDEDSYRKIGGGARAVCIEATDKSRLQYRAASRRTLAISHVWNHGQGGRPEPSLSRGDIGGFNACLHDRYRTITREFGCISYWMDTPCIPEDHTLRAESIANINKVFNQSFATLICDRDIMDIDVTSLKMNPRSMSGPMMRLRESILATILVCDWNLRSWTLLESMRGRKNIHLLCKYNHVISLLNLLRDICSYGSIDVLTLFMSAQHMLPARQTEPQLFPARQILGESIQGFIPLEEAACLLGHRLASRSQDDIVIWSLLTGEQPYYDAQSWWRAQVTNVRTFIRSGFILSSAPRLIGVKGLHWAPTQPSLHLSPPMSRSTKVYQPDDGSETRMARITNEGLLGTWGACVFETKGATTPDSVRKTLDEVASKFLSQQWGILLSPLQYNERLQDLTNPRLRELFRYEPVKTLRFRGTSHFLFGVAGSDDKLSWQWRGVYEWPEHQPLPKFLLYDNVLLT